MLNGHPSPDKLAYYTRLRTHSKRRRLVSMGWRLGLILASRKTGRQVSVTATTFWGDRMRVLLPESLSCELYGYRYFEEGLSAFLLQEVRSGQCVYDIGSHFGYFTRLSSALVGDSGAVHSFEPTPTTFALLSRNTADLANVTCNQTAVWRERDTLELKDFGPQMSMFNSLLAPRLGNAHEHAAVTIAVAAVALDDYAKDHLAPDVVKIDAESAEWSILQGMSHLLTHNRPKVTIEVGDFDVAGAAKSRALLDHVIGYGYSPYEYRAGKIVPHEVQDTYGYDNIFLMPV